MSFLTGYLTADLATRKDRTGEVEELRGDVDGLRDDAELARMKAQTDREIAVTSITSWKTTAHILRARLQARRETEEELLEQLTAAEVYSIPLGNQDAFENQYTKHYAKALTDPSVIEETFENGNLPESAVELIEDWKKEKGIE